MNLTMFQSKWKFILKRLYDATNMNINMSCGLSVVKRIQLVWDSYRAKARLAFHCTTACNVFQQIKLQMLLLFMSFYESYASPI